jgi:hypothetical protein
MQATHISRFFLMACLSACASLAQAQTSNRFCPDFLSVKGAPEPAHRGEITFSPYTRHWTPSNEHKQVVLVAIDEQLPGDRLCGISFFSNSFG